MDKIQVYYFNNGSGGGVFSVIKNLVRYSNNQLIDNHIIYTINKDSTAHFITEKLEGAKTESVFYYSPKWNFYYTCRELAKFLPGDQALIVANDWLELGMVSNLGLQNKVIQILHGDYDYYYGLSLRHKVAIDSFITVAKSINEKLQALLPDRQTDVHYLRFPVPENIFVDTEKQNNSVVFIGRCTQEKGYYLLPAIAESLLHNKLDFRWHIIGNATSAQKNIWQPAIDVKFHGLLPNTEVNRVLQGMQFFILPSIAEGMPVSLIESMKAGVIPVINNLPGGIQELVKKDETGYLVSDNSIEEYVQMLALTAKDNKIKNQLSYQCGRIANALFNPYTNTKSYENLFEQVIKKKQYRKAAIKIYGSRMDRPWIMNSVTNFVRNIFKN